MRTLEDTIFYLEDMKQLINGNTFIFIRDDITIKYSGIVDKIPYKLRDYDVIRIVYELITDQLTIYIRA